MTAGRVRITDLIDADAGSPRYCGHSIGRVIAIAESSGTKWLRIDRIERSGDRVYGVGVLVSPTQAEKIQAKWDVRWGLRSAPNPAPPPVTDRPPSGKRSLKFSDIDGAAAAIVSAGYRDLAKRHHPDVGGDHAVMTMLTRAHEQLRTILKMAKENQ